MPLLLILLAATLAQPYDFTPPRPAALRPAPRWEKLLHTQVRYLMRNAPAGEIPNELEHAIRPRTATALSAAVCLKFAGCEDPATIETLRRTLREVTRTHLTGGGKTASGRAWGHHWQSALWAWQAAFGAWLVWPELPADLRQAVVAITIDEADRFIDLPPPYSEFFDTKAEENAWNSLILVLASEAIAGHPHQARWRTRALEYMISAFATRADRMSGRRIDGRRLLEWAGGVNVHTDYTLENHGFVHPDYMTTISLNLSNAVVYRLLGKPAPEAVFHNAREIYANLKFFALPDGAVFYPSGTDWNLHRLEMAAELHVQMERLAGDQDAGALADLAMATLERMQARNPDGRTFVPGEYPSYPGHEEHAAWMYAFSVLHARLWDPPANPKPPAEVWRDLEGGRFFDDARMFVMRTPQAISSFSWGLRIMGQTIPFSPDPILNPLNHSYVGLANPPVEPGKKPGRLGIGSTVLERAIAQDAISIGTVIPGQESGAMHVTIRATHSGRAHVFSFTALPSGKSVYIERWGGRGPALGGLLSLLAEEQWVYGSAKRRIQHDGRTWLNVDDRLGYAIWEGGGIRQIPDVRNVLVALNDSPSGDAVIVSLPNSSAQRTRQFAGRGGRLRADQADVAAVLIDGLIVATNLSAHPIIATVEGAGKPVRIPINGYSTRVLPADKR